MMKFKTVGFTDPECRIVNTETEDWVGVGGGAVLRGTQLELDKRNKL